MPLTRIAPTPSGYLHAGNAINFLITAEVARAVGAGIRLRIDDLDAERMRPPYVDDIFASLRWLGIAWSEGPRDRMEHERMYSQLSRLARYEECLHVLKEQQKKAEVSRLEQLKEQVENELRNNARLAQFASQIKMDMTRDGLRIQIVDELARPMFDSGSAVVKPYMRELLRAIGGILTEVPNRLTLEGHTDGQPFGANDRGYSNWELSSDRANASRRELMAGGLAEDRVLRVQGLAASSLYVKDDPFDPQNRRISIIVMNREAEEALFVPQLEAPASGEAPSIRPERPSVVSSQPMLGR